MLASMVVMIDYAAPGPLTDLHGVDPAALLAETDDPVSICWPAHGLVIQPSDTERLGLSSGRLVENQIRPARKLIETLLAMDPAPLSKPREPERRVVGTCRHFALIGCALLRHRGIAARVRCGFATYFQPDQGLDHWIIEYRVDRTGRWVRVDAEILGQSIVQHPEDLGPGQFLTGGEAWTAFRQGDIDASTFGVYGSDNWGPGEIRGNLVKDLAALNKVEVLPWDVWGRMEQAYQGKTDADYDQLLDTTATACAADDLPKLAELYERDDLQVPADMTS